MELAEAASEAGVGDEAAPAPADERGADERRGLVRRQAEEHLLHELIRQLQRPPHVASARRRRAAELGFCCSLDFAMGNERVGRGVQ